MGPILPPRFRDDSITRQKIRPGTVRRILPFATRYRWPLALLLLTTALDAVITVASPLVLKAVIDDGIVPRHQAVVIVLASAIAALALVDAAAVYVQTRSSARIGQGLVFDLRTRVFDHVQRQPLAFFTRTQTGALVSRLNSDVIGAQQALTSLLSQTLSTVLTLVLVIGAMLYLSWQITVVSVLIIPLFLMPAKMIGRRIQRVARQSMQLDAELGSMMNERFNVSGAMLAKLYGRPETEAQAFAGRAGRVRDLAVVGAVYGRSLFIILSMLTALTTAVVYGMGGALAIHGSLRLGTLVAMVTLLLRLYGPINQVSAIQTNVVTALVSFDRVFEVLDLRPLISERPTATALTAAAGGDGSAAPDVEFDEVTFTYPKASEVSLASLEAPGSRSAESGPDAPEPEPTLRGISFTARAGTMTALVGPSGAGKTTISNLVPRLYDPTAGTVRIAGQDLRDVTLASVNAAVGVVTQDSHLFHDTIRANLLYAKGDATEGDLAQACEAARIWTTIQALPEGLDTVVGDRGHRLSGGEKQRIAIARLLLKNPPIVVLDEATAHLDSESENAIQLALQTALAGRTSIVIAHRLSTIRSADLILVVEAGRIRERGTHDDLLAEDGLYAQLYHTQYAGVPVGDTPAELADPVPAAFVRRP
jgi:ATP-binding cassette subfamily B protein